MALLVKAKPWLASRTQLFLLSQVAVVPGSDADSDGVKPALSFVIQNPQTSCSVWCPTYGTRY